MEKNKMIKKSVIMILFGAAVASCDVLFGQSLLISIVKSKFITERLIPVSNDTIAHSKKKVVFPTEVDCSDLSEVEIGRRFEECSSGSSKPCVLRNAIRVPNNLTLENIKTLFQGLEEFSLEKRIDPLQPDTALFRRLEMYEENEVAQVNQVFFPHARSEDARYIRYLAPEAYLRVMNVIRKYWITVALTLNIYKSNPSPTGVAWHAHLIEAPTTLHVVGNKKWRLISPEYTALMKPVTSFTGAVLFSAGFRYSYKGKDPDLFIEGIHNGKIPVYEVTCKPGDILVAPAGWWHSTENDKDFPDTISLVFSHYASPYSLSRIHPSLPFLSIYNLLYLAAEETIKYGLSLTTLTLSHLPLLSWP